MTSKWTAKSILYILLLACLMVSLRWFSDVQEIVFLIIGYIAGAFSAASQFLFPDDDNTGKGASA